MNTLCTENIAATDASPQTLHNELIWDCMSWSDTDNETWIRGMFYLDDEGYDRWELGKIRFKELYDIIVFIKVIVR